jgi:hypothetical protein
MTEGARRRPRTAVHPLDVSAWIVALLVLTVVAGTNETLADNRFFFVSHSTSPSWLVAVWLAILAVLLGALTGVFAAIRWVASERVYDLTASLFTFVTAAVLISSALPAGAALVAAVLFTLAARHILLGKALLVIAAVVAMVPLASASAKSANPYADRAVSYEEGQQRPDILWLIPDSVQYPLLFDEDGEVRPQFPNLRALQRESTTYTHTYTTANVTAAAVPSMLNGVGKVTGETAQWVAMTSSQGIASWMSGAYDVTVESTVFPDLCASRACAEGDASLGSHGADLLLLAADVGAVAGRTLHPLLAAQFPPLENRWRDFWAAQDHRAGSPGGEESLESRLASTLADRDTPQFVTWHSDGTHEPFDSDFEGRQIYTWDPSLGDGTLGVNDDSSTPSEAAERLPRRLYAADAVAFDRRLGVLLDDLAATGADGELMIVVTSDHGRSFPRRHHARVGDDAAERWSEVAHVPLMVKRPGQTRPEAVTDIRTTAQITRTLLDAAGVRVDSGPPMPPALDEGPGEGPFFWVDLRGGPAVVEAMPAGEPKRVVWPEKDLVPASEDAPFAVVDDDLVLGEPLAGDWDRYEPAEMSVNSADSSQQLLVVETDRTQCTDGGRVAITLKDSLVGQIEWDETNLAPADGIRGWAIVPKAPAGDYAFWCQAG